MAVCSFCGNRIMKGTGKIYVFKTGRISSYCSMKCEKNDLKLKRKASNLKWTKKFKKGTS